MGALVCACSSLYNNVMRDRSMRMHPMCQWLGHAVVTCELFMMAACLRCAPDTPLRHNRRCRTAALRMPHTESAALPPLLLRTAIFPVPAACAANESVLRPARTSGYMCLEPAQIRASYASLVSHRRIDLVGGRGQVVHWCAGQDHVGVPRYTAVSNKAVCFLVRAQVEKQLASRGLQARSQCRTAHGWSCCWSGPRQSRWGAAPATQYPGSSQARPGLLQSFPMRAPHRRLVSRQALERLGAPTINKSCAVPSAGSVCWAAARACILCRCVRCAPACCLLWAGGSSCNNSSRWHERALCDLCRAVSAVWQQAGGAACWCVFTSGSCSMAFGRARLLAPKQVPHTPTGLRSHWLSAIQCHPQLSRPHQHLPLKSCKICKSRYTCTHT